MYSTNKSFVEEAHKRGLEITLAMNPQCTDTGSKPATSEIGRVLSISGERLVAPWMRAWKAAPRYYGCVNNPDYLKIAFDFASMLLEIGSDGIQHDDPGANGEASQWDQGDPASSGCYCSHCMAGFTQSLMAHLSEPERAQLNVTAAFDYKELLLREAWNGTSLIVAKLRPLFVEYQQNVSENYLSTLRGHINEKAAALGRTTSLSCNGGSGWKTRMACDFVLGELNAGDATPEGLEAIFTTLLPVGKAQVMTMPKHHNVTLVNTPAFAVLIRTSIAYAYALGSQMMAPWDIYLPTPHATRYYGLASQYGDLYAFVRAHAELLDATTEPIPDPRAGAGGSPLRYNHTLAGGVPGKLGHRWRFPFPYTSKGYSGAKITGSKFSGQSLLSCEYLCDNDPLCQGIFFSGECFTLHDLIECNTFLHGDSYTRNRTAPPPHGHPAGPPPAAASSEEEVRAKVRLAGNRSVAAVHFVDWRNAMPAVWSGDVLPTNSFGPFTLNISNAILSAAPPDERSRAEPCGGMRFTRHQLDKPAKPIEGACDAAAGVTTLTLPSPKPWGLVEVRMKHDDDDTQGVVTSPPHNPFAMEPYPVFWAVHGVNASAFAANGSINIAQYGIKNHSFTVCGGMLGSVMPTLSPDGEPKINGGVPQAANLSVFLDGLAKNIEANIPEANYAGLAVFDFEAFTPLWSEDTGSNGGRHTKFPFHFDF